MRATPSVLLTLRSPREGTEAALERRPGCGPEAAAVCPALTRGAAPRARPSPPSVEAPAPSQALQHVHPDLAHAWPAHASHRTVSYRLGDWASQKAWAPTRTVPTPVIRNPAHRWCGAHPVGPRKRQLKPPALCSHTAACPKCHRHESQRGARGRPAPPPCAPERTETILLTLSMTVRGSWRLSVEHCRSNSTLSPSAPRGQARAKQ